MKNEIVKCKNSMDFKELMTTTEYDFLRDNPRLGDRIILLGVTGSYGYGTNSEGSDIFSIVIIYV